MSIRNFVRRGFSRYFGAIELQVLGFSLSRFSAIAIAALLAVSPAVQAEIVNVEFQGEGFADVIDDNTGETSGGVVLLIVGSFSIDTAVTSGGTNNFTGAAASLELTIDVAAIEGDIGLTDLSVFPYFTSFVLNPELTVGDVFVGSGPEEIDVDFPSFGGGGPVPLGDEQFSLILQGASGVVTADDLVGAAVLLGTPNILSMFGTTEVLFQSTSLLEDPFVDGLVFDLQFITATASTVPVPAAVWLLGSALGLLGWMRRNTA